MWLLLPRSPKAASANATTDVWCHFKPGHVHLVLSAECDATIALTVQPCFVVLLALSTIWDFLKNLVLIAFPGAVIDTMTRHNMRRKRSSSAYNIWLIA